MIFDVFATHLPNCTFSEVINYPHERRFECRFGPGSNPLSAACKADSLELNIVITVILDVIKELSQAGWGRTRACPGVGECQWERRRNSSWHGVE